jgi:hypothetical protein
MSLNLRRSFLQSAITACEPPVTFERVVALLPDDFALERAEFDEMVANASNNHPETADASNDTSTPAESAKPEKSEAPTEMKVTVHGEWDVVPPTAAEARIALDLARVNVRVLSDRLRVARHRLGDCLTRYMQSRGAMGPTPDELRRDFCKQEMEQRAAKAAGHGPNVTQGQPGPSKLDRMMFYTGKAAGDIDDHGAIQHGGHRRGAMPASQRGRRVAPR